MNYYPYTGNPSTDKIGIPGMYGTPAMAAYQQQQASMQAAGQPTGMPPSAAQHYATLAQSPNYPATSIYASNPYGSVPAMSQAAANAYAQQQRPAGTSATAHPGYTTNPYAMQGMSAAAYSTMVPATTSYPGSSYSVGSSSMLGYPAHAQIRSPSVGAYQAVGGYPAGMANPSIPAYNPATGVTHPGLVRAAPGYPGTSPYSRLP